jgi:hypothetical protein
MCFSLLNPAHTTLHAPKLLNRMAIVNEDAGARKIRRELGVHILAGALICGLNSI